MSRFDLFCLAVLTAVSSLVATVVGHVNAAAAAFGCFYTAPIGGEKCANIDGPDPFWTGFYDALGLFSIPWTVVLVFFLISNRRRIV